MINKYIAAAGVACSMVLASSCGSGADAQEELARLPQVRFEVRDSLVGTKTSFAKHKLALRAPQGWQQYPDSALKTMSATSESSELFAVWTGAGEAMLLCSKVLEDYADEPLSEITEKQRLYFLTQFDSTKIRHSEFLRDSLPCVQFIIDDGKTIRQTFLLRSPNATYYQFDYFLPAGEYAAFIGAVKSSFGSIQFLTSTDL